MHSVVKTWLAFGLAFFLVGCNQETVQSKPEIHITGSTMGTYYSIKVADGVVSDAAQLQANVDKLLEKVNDQMSTYRPNSELSRFNQHRSATPVIVSRDTAKVVTEAIHIGRASQGALDVTVGPLVNLWGFGPDKKPTKIPSDELIAHTRQQTGLANLHVTTSLHADTLQKDIPDLYVDLSSIAKGFGVDKVAEYLEL
ncbi:MAG: FAD:protein FMN transferase, partial [Aeromonas sp.]